ncbi:MAG: acyltransferase family protein [Rubrivivax sp.]|nr:acyltransferase family protein [Rubrivivax sp.]
MTTSTPHQSRQPYLDWLRIGAFGLLVLYHVGMLYVSWPFHIKSPVTFTALEPWMRLLNPWRMSLLFMISGLATGLMLGRPGLARQRSQRLLLPLLLGVAVVVPPQAYLEVRQQLGYAGGYADFLRLYFSGYAGFCRQDQCLRLPTWNHLWFLPYLWVYTAVLLAAWRLLPRHRLSRWANGAAGLAGWRLLFWPWALLALARLVLLPRFGDTHALVDDWYNHAVYGAVFAFGVLLARRPVLLARLEQLRWPALCVTFAAWLALVAASGHLAAWPEVPEVVRLPLRALYAAQQWGALVAAFGFARRHLNRDHRWRAPLNEAVFPLYIVHQTLIIAGAVALFGRGLPVGVEAFVLVAGAWAGGLLAWQLARRLPWLRPWMGLAAAPAAQREVAAKG